jgi:ATP synthase protein I
MPERDNGGPNQKSGIAYAAGFTLFMSVATLTIVGWVVDKWAGTSPWFLLAGIVLGAIAGFYQFVRLTSRL